jgi:hypothetical protein
LSELLAAVIEPAGERLDLLMHDLVCTHVATMRKGLAADVATVWTLSCVASLMRLQN